MIVIDDTIISDIIIEKYFCCDIPKCCGACCVEGDAGAPLESKEVDILIENFHIIKNHMTPESIKLVENSGVYQKDPNGNYNTPLLKNRDCVYLYYDDGIAKCCIEKAFNEKEIKFQKPVSCHLYPIRITEYSDFSAINYHQWFICDDAVAKGKSNKILIYQFLKEPLIRKFGKKWYKKLEEEVKKRSPRI